MAKLIPKRADNGFSRALDHLAMALKHTRNPHLVDAIVRMEEQLLDRKNLISGVLLNEAAELINQENWAKAKRVLQKVLKKNPHVARGWFYMALARTRGQPSAEALRQAKDDLNSALFCDPDPDLEEAVQSMFEQVEEALEGAELMEAMEGAQRMMRNERWGAAARELKALKRRYPNEPIVIFYHAQCVFAELAERSRYRSLAPYQVGAKLRPLLSELSRAQMMADGELRTAIGSLMMTIRRNI